MKFMTVVGVSFSNNLQRKVPAVVLKTAVGSPAAALVPAAAAVRFGGVAGFAA
jgi:hypothetical protein